MFSLLVLPHDGELSNKEFVSVMKNRLLRGLDKPMDTGFVRFINSIFHCGKEQLQSSTLNFFFSNLRPANDLPDLLLFFFTIISMLGSSFHIFITFSSSNIHATLLVLKPSLLVMLERDPNCFITILSRRP
ncbi:unnamed protein product [Protopolystoma xenopodis]|uniref:EF-hand domain-containing protein n=1 Tax=Protopolystoma xenopodis TaxID=117903 RepID=A0A3S5C424_9PLAT|nr:unnamed protein product [Protopolystoma xenopodis]